MSRQSEYYTRNKDEINKDRRALYVQRKADGLCVRCGLVAANGTIWCSKHLEQLGGQHGIALRN